MSARPSVPAIAHILLADAATCVVLGAALTIFPEPLSSLLGLPPSLLLGAGLLLFPCAILMAIAARVATLTGLLGRIVVLGNVAWAAASFGVLAAYDATAFGQVFVVAQALAVLVIAALESRALRQPPQAYMHA